MPTLNICMSHPLFFTSNFDNIVSDRSTDCNLFNHIWAGEVKRAGSKPVKNIVPKALADHKEAMRCDAYHIVSSNDLTERVNAQWKTKSRVVHFQDWFQFHLVVKLFLLFVPKGRKKISICLFCLLRTCGVQETGVQFLAGEPCKIVFLWFLWYSTSLHSSYVKI